MLVAEEFYILTFEKGSHRYRESEFTIEHDWKTEMKFFPTAKADLYFAEQRAKRIDRIITLSIGVIVGIVSALSAAYFKALFGD